MPLDLNLWAPALFATLLAGAALLALAGPDGTTDEWSEAENLAEALAEYQPICSQCHIARPRQEPLRGAPSTRGYRKSGDS